MIESKDIRFDDDSISLLRNGFTYHQFYYHEIDEVRIYKGFLLKNNLIVMFCSIGIGMWSSYLLKMSYQDLYAEGLNIFEWLLVLNRGLLFTFFGPLLLFFAALLAFLKSFEPAYIARIKVGQKIYRPRLKEIAEIDKLKCLLRNKYLTVID